MLILTRRVGETLIIGDDVTITVWGVRGTKFVLVLTLLKMLLSTVKKFTSVFRLKKHNLKQTQKSTVLLQKKTKLLIIKKPVFDCLSFFIICVL